jgi:methionyl-tRNA formyltransferase
MRIIYFGTPALSAKLLELLLESEHELVAVVTQADKPQGRHQHLGFSAVKKLVLEKAPNMPVLQPIRAKEVEFLEQLKAFKADLFVVAAYGQILPQVLLDLPRLDCINVHYSLLPLLRGAAPIQRSILEGHKETGVCIMKMVLAMDAGPVYAMKKIELDEQITAGGLSEKLTQIAGPLLLKVIQDLVLNRTSLSEQDGQKVTFAPKIETQDAQIDWHKPAVQLNQLIRAMDPAPGAWCEVKVRGQSKRVKIFGPKIVFQEGFPGQILEYGKKLVVACGQQALEIEYLQPEGKGQMSVASWCNGQPRDQVKF